jgi:hypothetical protein
MHFYKETPAQGTRTLGNIPLFLLPDLSLYLKDPLLKRSLWKALYREGLKNRESVKEAPQTFWPERATIAKGKARSEDEKFGVKPTLAGTEF